MNTNYIQLFPVVIKLIGFAENFIGGQGKGALKKSLVLDLTHALMDAGVVFADAPHKEFITKMEKPVEMLVDALVAIANTAGWTAIEEDSAVKA